MYHLRKGALDRQDSMDEKTPLELSNGNATRFVLCVVK